MADEKDLKSDGVDIFPSVDGFENSIVLRSYLLRNRLISDIPLVTYIE